MKIIIIVFNILLFGSQIFAQCDIPNAGFENWTGIYPDDWELIHASDTSAVFKTSDSYSGNFALRLDTASSYIGIKSGAITCNDRPASLQGYYKMEGKDSLGIIITLTDGLLNTIASGTGLMVAPHPNYAKFKVALEYNKTTTPAYAFINIIGSGHGTIYIDELFFNGTTLTPIIDSIPTRDNKKLAADIYLPNTTGVFPVILVQTPYNRKLFSSVGLPANIGFNIESSNYAFVAVDWRGFYGSTGASLPVITSQRRGEDGYDIIDWIKNQPWSNGKVGTYGGSAVGRIQYLTAREHHPNHICAVPSVVGPVTSNYFNYFPNGVLRTEYIQTLDMLGYNMSEFLLDIDSSRFYNDVWEHYQEIDFYPEEIAIPMLITGGWYDHNTDEIIEWYDSLYLYSDPAIRDKHRLLFGPWTHGGYTTSGIGSAMQGELNYSQAENWNDSLAELFFDYYLRNQNNGWENTPNVKYFQMGENYWNSSPSWPPESINDITFYLHANETIDNDIPLNSTDKLSYIYDPEDPSPTWGGKTMRFDMLQGPYDQSYVVENRNDILIFSTPVLTQDIVMQGKMKINLYISSDRLDTDFVVRLTDVYPDGRSILVMDNIQRMRFRNGYRVTDTAMMVPGQVYPVTIELTNTALTFLAGHKIRIDITSSNYPRFNRNMNTGGDMYPNHNGDTLVNPLIATNTVYCNSIYPSNIMLPLKNYSTGIHVNQLNNEFDIKIYPNPTTGVFTIVGENIKSVEIININGQVVKKFQVSDFVFQVDLSNYPREIYFVKIKSDNYISVKKIVIQ